MYIYTHIKQSIWHTAPYVLNILHYGTHSSVANLHINTLNLSLCPTKGRQG